jgi:hypothetical protein
MRARGAMGVQPWRPASSNAVVASTRATGVTRTRPLMRATSGNAHSSMATWRAVPSHDNALGPMESADAVRRKSSRVRSVSAQYLRFREYSATLSAQWFSGSFDPHRRAAA